MQSTDTCMPTDTAVMYLLVYYSIRSLYIVHINCCVFSYTYRRHFIVSLMPKPNVKAWNFTIIFLLYKLVCSSWVVSSNLEVPSQDNRVYLRILENNPHLNVHFIQLNLLIFNILFNSKPCHWDTPPTFLLPLSDPPHWYITRNTEMRWGGV